MLVPDNQRDPSFRQGGDNNWRTPQNRCRMPPYFFNIAIDDRASRGAVRQMVREDVDFEALEFVPHSTCKDMLTNYAG